MARKTEKDKVQEDFELFQKGVEQAKSNREFILSCLKDARFVKIISLFERETEDAKENLVTAEKKDVEGKQAFILARRSLLATLRGAYESELEEAARQLEEFKIKNELLLTASEKREDSGKESKAAG